MIAMKIQKKKKRIELDDSGLQERSPQMRGDE